jgi:hypothetical protein
VAAAVTARVRKARTSKVRACGCYVTTGQLIVSHAPGLWVCLEHALAAIRRAPRASATTTSRKANTP